MTLLVGSAAGLPRASLLPPTPTVALPSAIDSPSFYEKQTKCDPVARPGALALQQLLLTTYGPATIYIPRACSGSVSEHFDGRAVDWMRSVRVPAEREQAESFLAWVLAPGPDGTPMEMARRLGIMYLIWNNRMIRSYDPGRGWTNYQGCMAAGRQGKSQDNSCHRNHIHISLSWDGAAMATSWYTGTALTQPYCSSRTTSGASPGPGDPQVIGDPAAVAGLVPIPPAVVLDTAAGTGLPSSCRLLRSRTLPVDLTPAVIGTDARAVAIRVEVRSNAPAAVSVWSSGRSMPPGQVPAPLGQESAATLLVPLSSKGTLGMATSLGAANVRVTVLGYLTTDLPGASGSAFPPPGRTQAPAPAPAPTTPVPETGTSPAPAATPASKPAAPLPGAKPSKPRAVKARVTKGVVTVSWKPPVKPGSYPISGYRVAALYSPKQVVKVAAACETAAEVRSCQITGLKRGRAFWLSLRATNAAGSTWAAKKKVVAK